MYSASISGDPFSSFYLCILLQIDAFRVKFLGLLSFVGGLEVSNILSFFMVDFDLGMPKKSINKINHAESIPAPQGSF